MKTMVSLKFHCKDDVKDFIEVEVNDDFNGLFITIQEDDDSKVVHLDKSTAIKLSKELRKQIALLD